MSAMKNEKRRGKNRAEYKEEQVKAVEKRQNPEGSREKGKPKKWSAAKGNRTQAAEKKPIG
jgi:hypothetical protein